jgi:hypothetical protein
MDINVTDLVVDMINTPTESHGFMINLLDEEFGNYNRNVVFASSNNEIPELRPKLVVYTNSYANVEEPIINEDIISVYPNPGTGKYNVEVLKNINQIQYTISDACGNTILFGESDTAEFDVNITSSPAGIYMLTISVNNRMITKKLMKL